MNQKTNTKLSIDVINRYYYPVTAGIETFLINVYPALYKKGWNINMHASKNTLSSKGVLKDFEVVDGVNINRYPLRFFGYFPKIDYQNTKIVHLFNFDVFPHFYILSFSHVLKLLGKKKFTLVLSPQGGFTPEWSTFPFFFGLLKKIYHFTLGALLINHIVDYLIPISEWEKIELSKRGIVKPKLITIGNGIEEEAYENIDSLASINIKNQIKRLDRYIIQIGRIHPIKNYETSIHALSLLSDNIKLVIIGPIMDKEYAKKINQVVTDLNLQSRVIFLGVITKIDKYYLIKKAQALIHTSKNESFCHAVNEGLSQGKICIVANNTNLPFLVKNGINGYCVETNNYREFAENLKYVLENINSKKMQKMSEVNKKKSLKNSWNDIAMKVNKIYQQLI
ncbi:glycosyltransferase family 4 protein [Candidatus Gottesmanbacteria bacterium]|nr:glycosyltransferase family 4 protein [Candidatus Gottesmanbacteria bacterium]